MPVEAEFFEADIEDVAPARRACVGLDVLVCAVGFPYRASVYERLWPIAMRNLLDGCARSGARFVFADTLYMYGPRTGVLTEDLPLTDYGRKPRVRAEVTRLWQAAHGAGHVRAVAVRASDFYGPNVPTSVLSEYGVARLLAGKPAFVPYNPNHPHDFTFVPDFARALATLIDAPDDVYGQAWHVPNAPTRSLRDLLVLALELIGVAPRIRVLPSFLASVVGFFKPEVRELAEMSFQWDRPYIVSAAKFNARFGSDATPFEEGLRATIDYYRGRAR